VFPTGTGAGGGGGGAEPGGAGTVPPPVEAGGVPGSLVTGGGGPGFAGGWPGPGGGLPGSLAGGGGGQWPGGLCAGDPQAAGGGFVAPQWAGSFGQTPLGLGLFSAGRWSAVGAKIGLIAPVPAEDGHVRSSRNSSRSTTDVGFERCTIMGQLHGFGTLVLTGEFVKGASGHSVAQPRRTPLSETQPCTGRIGTQGGRVSNQFE
jgi:hypothetical protein